MANQKPIVLKGLSDTGRVRELNEDSFGTAPALQVGWKLQEERGTLVAVADGMGGHAAGEVASKMAIETLFKTYYADKEQDPAKALADGFAAANTRVHEAASADPSKTSMGSTLVAAVVRRGKLYVANVGDSRAYLVRGGKIRQITHDHSWVAEQVRARVLTPEQAQQHVYKNIITRAIGNRAEVKVDTFSEQLKANDIIVLGSDGLTNKVAPNEIAAIVSSTPDPNQAVQKLIGRANENGGDDNITAIVVRVPEVPGALPVVATAVVTLALLAMAAYLTLPLVFQPIGVSPFAATSTIAPTSAPVVVPTLIEVGSPSPTRAPSPTASFILPARTEAITTTGELSSTHASPGATATLTTTMRSPASVPAAVVSSATPVSPTIAPKLTAPTK